VPPDVDAVDDGADTGAEAGVDTDTDGGAGGAVPETITTALEDQPVDGAVCLEAGAGVGNATAGLLRADAARVYAVTNDRDHALTVRRWIGRSDRLAVLEADLRAVPLARGAVDVITAHGLFNVLAPAALPAVAAEFTRVGAPGCRLVIDDYAPLPGPESGREGKGEPVTVRDLFAAESAAAALARGRPALTFYPAAVLRRLFAGYGWTFERERTLLDPVPWTESHLDAHAGAARAATTGVTGPVAESLESLIDRVEERVDPASVGEMYSVAMRLPE